MSLSTVNFFSSPARKQNTNHSENLLILFPNSNYSALVHLVSVRLDQISDNQTFR